MGIKGKRGEGGLSPLAATVLLIIIALVALALLFIWFNTLGAEEILKFGLPIENQCGRLEFESDVSSNTISIDNKGQIGIYGINLEVNRQGKVTTRFLRPIDSLISSGEKDSVTADVVDLSGKIDSITVVPVLLGENLRGERKLHACLEQGQLIG